VTPRSPSPIWRRQADRPIRTSVTSKQAGFDWPTEPLPETAEDLHLGDADAAQDCASASFGLLALSVGLLAPIAILVGRLSRDRLMRYAVVVGILAAIVQVTGLIRWPLLVPGFADRYASGGIVFAVLLVRNRSGARSLTGNA
jgi:hypothetical protein